ncbi:MAG: DNA alkylation repair protein [Prevotella sp.]|nr:DNA alkylation repair protein [Prevotella sp.]
MTPIEIESKLKEIKRSFRLMMNGPASQSMREKGVEYHLNWGVPLMELRTMAKELGQDYHLAIALWKEDIRECKILATLVMPHDQMPKDIAALWMEQVRSQEMAEMLAFNLLQYVDYAPEIAYEWMASSQPTYLICAFDIVGRLFMRGQEPNDRGVNEFIDQAIAALHDPVSGVRHAAMNALIRFADLGLVYERIAQSATRRAGFDFL